MDESKQTLHTSIKITIQIIVVLILTILLYLSSLYNYLLFHFIAESFSIIVSSAIFIIVWHSRNYSKDNFLIFLGIAYLFIGIIDLFHTLAYKGMPIFTDYDYYANQLWIASRYMESLSLLIFALYCNKKRKINFISIFLIFLFTTIVLLLSIFYYKVFPICFVEGQGLTPFKKISEYIICSIILVSIIIIFFEKHFFTKKIFIFIILSMIFTVISEFMFTLYISNYGIENLIGHYLKIVSFLFIYQSLIVTSIEDPFELIFKKLKDNERKLMAINATKDKLFSIIAHDLKNSFNGVMGISNLITINFNKYSDEKKLFFIKKLNTTSENTFKLLENLLYWSRSQLGSISYTPIKIIVNSIVDECIELYKNLAEQKEIHLYSTLSSTLIVNADKDMISTIFRNLISNALKFTPNGGKVYIEGTQTEKEVELCFIDTGVGMTQNDIQLLFNLETNFSKYGTNNEKGTGLGLILCKEFIEKNHGSIRVESEVGNGTRFYVTFPVYPP